MKKEQKEQDSKEEAYIDANCFIYASLNKEEVGMKAKHIFERIKAGFYKKAYTSTLTIDEFLWRMQKEVGRELAAEGTEVFSSLENFELLNVNSQIILEAIEIYKNEKIDPRGSIHAAIMKSKNIKLIISSDPDFDKIKGIQRIDFTKEIKDLKEEREK